MPLPALHHLLFAVQIVVGYKEADDMRMFRISIRTRPTMMTKTKLKRGTTETKECDGESTIKEVAVQLKRPSQAMLMTYRRQQLIAGQDDDTIMTTIIDAMDSVCVACMKF